MTFCVIMQYYKVKKHMHFIASQTQNKGQKTTNVYSIVGFFM